MITLSHLTKTYGDVAVVHDLSLTVEDRAFMVLIGESGSGKTTTLNMINRLIEPNSGQIEIDGADALAADAVALRRQMGFVFQAVGLFPHMTVAENIGITPKLLGWDKRKIATRVDELLTLVRLDPAAYRGRMAGALSGGQQQRVGVARALAAAPKIMLMDEPFGALDPLTRDDLATDYRRIHDQLGLTTVLVTHDMTEALILADRIAVMRDGVMVQIGTPNELLNKPADDFVRHLVETPKRRARLLAEAMASA
ncbi:MAG TPA: ABC transporter ATP-binding protein [Rhizomicrobium sp.]|jgi:osmoprotectant transport system ATP-binding protein